LLAAKQTGINTVVIGGGVAANSRLRSMAISEAEKVGVTIRIPRPGLCTDNGAMVAALGSHLFSAGIGPSDLTFEVDPILEITKVQA
jgi:N6-L-threonylcarbamoyladenine synthase